MTPRDILDFWFVESGPNKWWTSDATFDAQIEQRFGKLLRQASQGELYEWRSSAKDRLAEILVLDQFSRNVYRNSAAAFGQDPMALTLAQESVASGFHRKLEEVERTFLLMPYMHSESVLIHSQAEILFREYTPKENFEFELQHKAIVDRFGRYPHRNKILGRDSTAEELEFLKQPGSAF